MTRLQRFNTCSTGEYNNTAGMVSWKIINDTLYFQCSKQVEDWKRNFDIWPVKMIIGGIEVWVCRGFHDAYEELVEIIANPEIRGFCGYSHGAVFAAIAGAETGKPTTVFGCPNFLLNPTDDILDLFWNVEFVGNPRDIVTFLPPVYRKGRNVIKTIGTARRGSIPLLQWYSGHTPSEYRQRMTNV